LDSATATRVLAEGLEQHELGDGVVLAMSAVAKQLKPRLPAADRISEVTRPVDVAIDPIEGSPPALAEARRRCATEATF